MLSELSAFLFFEKKPVEDGKNGHCLANEHDFDDEFKAWERAQSRNGKPVEKCVKTDFLNVKNSCQQLPF